MARLEGARRDPAEHDSCVRPRRNAQPSPLGVVAGPGGSSRAATQGAHRPRPTPHPVPSHAAARTQRPPCPPAPTPRAPGTQRAAFSRPCPLARPRPQVCDQQRRGQTATRRGVARPPPPSGGARCGARSPSARPAARGARVVLESRAWPAGGGRRCAYVTFISLSIISLGSHVRCAYRGLLILLYTPASIFAARGQEQDRLARQDHRHQRASTPPRAHWVGTPTREATACASGKGSSGRGCGARAPRKKWRFQGLNERNFNHFLRFAHRQKRLTETDTEITVKFDVTRTLYHNHSHATLHSFGGESGGDEDTGAA